MPRISEGTRAKRRRHIMVSAWGCFARDGFHATSMDEIIAATGMSSSAVYRYFSGKDELIASAADEALGLVRDLLSGLLDADPVPDPGETIGVLVTELRSRMVNPDYDMSRIAIQAWGEALRNPEIARRTRAVYEAAYTQLVRLAEHWRASGVLGREADTTGVATLLLTLIPGLIIGHQLLTPQDAARLVGGILGLASGPWHSGAPGSGPRSRYSPLFSG